MLEPKIKVKAIGETRLWVLLYFLSFQEFISHPKSFDNF